MYFLTSFFRVRFTPTYGLPINGVRLGEWCACACACAAVVSAERFALSKPGPNREATEVHLTMTHFMELRLSSEAANAMRLDKRSLSAVAANVLWILSVTALKTRVFFFFLVTYIALGPLEGFAARRFRDEFPPLKLERSKQINQSNSLPENLSANCSGLTTSAVPALNHLGAVRCSKC